MNAWERRLEPHPPEMCKDPRGKDQDLKPTQRSQRVSGFWPAAWVSGLARRPQEGRSLACALLCFQTGTFPGLFH